MCMWKSVPCTTMMTIATMAMTKNRPNRLWNMEFGLWYVVRLTRNLAEIYTIAINHPPFLLVRIYKYALGLLRRASGRHSSICEANLTTFFMLWSNYASFFPGNSMNCFYVFCRVFARVVVDIITQLLRISFHNVCGGRLLTPHKEFHHSNSNGLSRSTENEWDISQYNGLYL